MHANLDPKLALVPELEAMEIFKIRDRRTMRQMLSFVRAGRRYLYRRADIQAFIENGGKHGG